MSTGVNSILSVPIIAGCGIEPHITRLMRPVSLRFSTCCVNIKGVLGSFHVSVLVGLSRDLSKSQPHSSTTTHTVVWDAL